MYTIVMDHWNTGQLIYLVVKQSDLGSYVVATAVSLETAKLICNALSVAADVPPPF